MSDVGKKFISDGRIFDAYNHTDHAAKLVKCAESSIDCGRFLQAMADLEMAVEANERAGSALAETIRKLKEIT